MSVAPDQDLWTLTLNRLWILEVWLVDTCDLVLGKLMSRREKDRDDLRVLEPQLDRQVLESRLRRDCQLLLREPKLQHNAEQNWYILYGESLPA